ncbi:uncharacterized protein DUF1700 [Kineothrix alysoides]|uniref:Uncharacterized protein DUF1700 n=2 Tax=Kineothrix alysoides TaxID=1469948 RepID=A0A4R1QU47_9FIRM|nr:uncharacterized protein DUF1700 [Kineothrix alysoides]
MWYVSVRADIEYIYGRRGTMTRNEFIETLQRVLAGSLSSSSVNENIRYYQDYIDMQIRLGQSEEEVIASLGDPRLLAKTIIEACKLEGRCGYQEYDEVYEEGYEEKERGGFGGKVYRMPGWLLGLIIAIVLIFIIGIIGSVLSVFLPIIIPILCVILLVRFLRSR